MKRHILTLGAAVLVAFGCTAAYAAAQSTSGASPDSRQARVQQRTQKRLDARFAALDTNHDGVLSRDEWRGRPALFNRLDANHDGVVSKDEIQQALAQRLTAIHQRVQKAVDVRFARLDTNHDGVISRDEWQGRPARFDRLDKNHDGVLSKDEFQPMAGRKALRRLTIRRLLIG